MATRDTGQPAAGITRRDFLKASAAATAVAGCGLEFMYDPAKAAAYETSTAHTVTFTTCPYCSASCGQRVVVEKATGKVVDMYGDFESPMNAGGLCAKGAGTYQLVTNPRRIGAWPGSHPVSSVFAARSGAWITDIDPVPAGWPGAETNAVFATYKYDDGVAYFRRGNDPYARVPLALAMKYAAQGLVQKRDGLAAMGDAPTLVAGANPKTVAFFGSSHMNNESNYMYRKIIANFGTANVEHQARI